jgi:glycosyltransferase involved in cell wall biosynthesis
MTEKAIAVRPTRAPIALPDLPAQPLVTVMVSNYNYARYLPEAIGSIIRQTYSHWELIVCDDGSTDDSCGVVARYAARDPRIQLIRQENGGQASALNAAFAASTGAILCVLDSDDSFHPQKLASVVRQFQQCPDAGLLVHAMSLVDADGARLHRIPILGAFEEGWIAARILRRGGRWRYMPASGLVFRRELAEIGFPIATRRFAIGADGFLFTLFPLLTKITFLAGELSTYRIHGGNVVGRLGVNAAAARKGARLMNDVVEGVNERLSQLASPDILDADANLHIALELLVANLLEGEARRRLYPRYFSAVRAILADDLYGIHQKAILPVLFGVAALLPCAWRQAWLDQAISAGALKRITAGVLAGFRRQVRVGS